MAIHHDFITPDALQVTNFMLFSDMVELHVVIGRAAHTTRRKTLVLGLLVKFGREFRKEGTRAEFLVQLGNVDELCAEMIRRKTTSGWPIPVVKIIMLFNRDLQ